jgi:uncharacterized OB-fold protein
MAYQQRKIPFAGDINSNPETKRVFEAASAGKLLVPHCNACGRSHWYPRGICPHCFSQNLAWNEASGKGTIYSFSIMRRAEVPYVMAYVTLEEGPTMMTNIVDCDLDGIKIGQRVTLKFVPSENGPPVPMFTPT